MRYIKTKKHYKIKTVLKSLFGIMLTLSVFVFSFRYLGDFIGNNALKCVLGELDPFDLTSFRSVKAETVSDAGFEDDFLKYVIKNEEAKQPQATVQTEIKTDNGPVAVNLSAVSGKYKNYGGTSVINNTDYNVNGLMYGKFEYPEKNDGKPYVLIYHTHTSEAYNGGGTVVDVGNAMAEEFERLGYKTIHLTTVYDKEQFSGAYSRSIKGVTEMLEKYPSIRLAFDVHRDSIESSDGTVYRPVTEIDGKQCAQVMIVCGTDAKGLKHPNWRQNFKYGLAVSRKMNEKYTALSRPVNLRGDRFNTHVTNHALLLEVGSEANTLDEAKRASVYTARAVIETITEK